MARVRPLALATALAALLAFTLLSGTAIAGNTQPDEAVLGRGLEHRQVMPALLPNSKENTSIVVQNNGNAPATIALDVYLPTGVPVPAASEVFDNVPPNATRVFQQALNSGLIPGFRGVGVVSSDQPILAIQARDIEQNGTGRKSYSLHNAYGEGANKITLPYVANFHNTLYNTRFAIANTGTSVACVTIQYAFVQGGGHTDNGPGGSGCATGYPVPVGGQIAFGPQAVPAEFTQAMPAATAGQMMSATITSTGSKVTVAVDAYLTNSPTRPLASYDGFVVNDAAPATDDVGTDLAVPVALKIDGFYTQILISNPNPTAATATITYRSQQGQTYTVNLNVPANGTANHSTYDAAGGIPEGFVGAARITASQPVAAVLFRAKMTGPGTFIEEDLYTAVNAIPLDRAATTVKAPLVFRQAYGNGALCQNGAGTRCGYNTSLSVIIADGTTANVTINTIADTTTGAPGCNVAATYSTTRAVTGSYIFYQNLAHAGDVNNGLGANPGCLWGGATITADKPIMVVVTVTNDLVPGDNDGQYNAFPS
jgi:hypothetical protein